MIKKFGIIALLSMPVIPTTAFSHEDGHGAIYTDWPICGSAKRITCVVDGDTVWWNGIKMRLLDIDTPEVQGRCQKERDAAQTATAMLQRVLSSGLIKIEATGEDRYGRKLVHMATHEGDVSQIMLATGTAMPYGNGDKQKWCR